MNQYVIKEIDPIKKTVLARFDYESASDDKIIDIVDINDVVGITTATTLAYKQFVSSVAQAPVLKAEVVALIDKPVDTTQTVNAALQAIVDTP